MTAPFVILNKGNRENMKGIFKKKITFIILLLTVISLIFTGIILSNLIKDTSGNVSEPASITFYKTTLDANGGSVTPTSVLTKSGNSFTFPTPTRRLSKWTSSSDVCRS